MKKLTMAKITKCIAVLEQAAGLTPAESSKPTIPVTPTLEVEKIAAVIKLKPAKKLLKDDTTQLRKALIAYLRRMKYPDYLLEDMAGEYVGLIAELAFRFKAGHDKYGGNFLEVDHSAELRTELLDIFHYDAGRRINRNGRIKKGSDV